MTGEGTRYARQLYRKQQEDRHARIVEQLTYDVRKEFDYVLESQTTPVPCAEEGWPSKWVDYDSNPAHREPQEGMMPTAPEAMELCSGCPLMAEDLCYRYALSTDQAHGVWGGRRFENGIVVRDGKDAQDRPNRERYR